LSHLNTGCVACPPGFYGTDPNRLECYPGHAGYYYLGGTTKEKPTNKTLEKGDMCPVGHYCPPETATPKPCPSGTFIDFEGAVDVSNCTACAANTYQYKNGSSTCFQCSSSSTSPPGSESCQCIGKNRAFQAADGYCICEPGYEFVDSNLQVSSTNDGVYDCQPIVYPQCLSSEVRLFDGSCATNSYCNHFCGSQGGTLSPAFGTCLCNNVTTLAEVCDEDCREQAVQVACFGTDKLIYTFADGSTHKVPISAVTSQGGLDCSDGKSIYSMSTTGGSFAGVFGTNEALGSASHSRRKLISRTNSTLSSRMLSTGASATLNNPIVTIFVGDSIVFDVSKASYPVYVKDSLLNTNPSFDYSAFRDLANTAQTTISFVTFSFTFADPGTYVFSVSSNSAAITLIKVLADNIAQQSQAQFVEFSENNLIVSGVKTSDNIVLSPDWNLVIGLLLGMLAIVLLVIGFLYYFRKKSWSYHTNIDALYRKGNKSTSFDNKGPKGGLFSGQKINKVFADNGDLAKDDLESPAFPMEDENPDEDGLLPELSRHLQSHHDEIDRQLLNQNDILNALQDTLKKEVDELKHLLQSTAMEISLNANSEHKNKKLQTLLLQLRADALARDAFESSADTTQKRIVASIAQLRDAFSQGPEEVAHAIVQDLSEQAVNLSHLDEQIIGMNSAIVEQLREYLGQIGYFTNNDLWVAIDEEKRRRKASDDAFEQGLKNLQAIIFPSDVLDCLKTSKDADIVTDLAMDNSSSVLKSFCDHIPQFVNFMTEVQSALSRGLARTVEKGNSSLVEKEQEAALSSFSGYLKDLLEAIGILENTYRERFGNLIESESEGKMARTQLLQAIDAALTALQAPQAFSDADPNSIQQILEPLLAALREGKIPDLQNISSPRTEQLGTIAEDEQEEVGPNVLSSVMSNENLSSVQKENILDSAEQDLKVMDSIIELERKRQEDEIQKALQFSGEKPEDDTASSSAKFKEEQKLLQQRLKEEREKELATFANQEVEDSKGMELIDVVQKAKSLGAYRCWSLLCRSKYREFAVNRLVLKAKLLEQLYVRESVTVDVIRTNLLKLADEEKKELNSLRESLQITLAAYLNDGKETTSDPNKEIVVSVELANIEKDLEKRGAEAKNFLSAAHDKLTKNSKLFASVRELVKKRSLTTNKNQQLSLSVDSLQGEDSSVEKLLQSQVENELTEFDTEEVQMHLALKDLVFGNTASVKQEKQRLDSYQLNALGTLQVYSTLENRLAFVEFENRNETDRIKLWTDLYSQQLSLDDQRVAFQEFAKKKSTEQSQLHSQLQSQIAKVHQIELDRQHGAEVNFEKERAFILERLFSQEQSLRIQSIKSQAVVESELLEVLKQRTSAVIDKMREMKFSPELLAWMLKRLQSDSVRAKLEFQLSYDSFEEGLELLSRYCVELLTASEGSAAYLKEITSYHHLNKLDRLLLITKVDDVTKRSRIQWSAESHREFEARRMKALSRTAEDYQAMCNDIRVNCQEELKGLDVSTAAELWRIKNNQEVTMEEKMSIHQRFGDEVAAVLAKQQNSKFTARGSAEDPPVFSEQILSQLLQIDSSTFNEYLDSFKSAISKLISNQRVEDELTTIRRSLKHESEEVDEMIELNENNRLEELLQSQTLRNESVEEARDNLQGELIGQLAVLEQKKADQANLLKQIAEIRKDERVKQLELEGISPEEAKRIAEAEKQERLKAEIAALENEHQKAVADLQNSAKAALNQQLQDTQKQSSDVSNQLEQGKPLENGSDVNSLMEELSKQIAEDKEIAKTEMDAKVLDLTRSIEEERVKGENAIRAEMDKFQEDRLQELIKEGLSEEEANRVAANEREQLERDRISQLSSELEEKLTKGHERIVNDYQKKLEELDQKLAVAMNLLTKGMKETIEEGMKDVKKAVAEEMERRREELARSGVPADEIEKILANEKPVKEKEAVDQFMNNVNNTKEQLLKENEKMLQKQSKEIEANYFKGLKGLEESLKQKREATKKHLNERLQQRLQQTAKKLQQENPALSAKEAQDKAKTILEAAGLLAGPEEELAKFDKEANDQLQGKRLELKEAENQVRSRRSDQFATDDQEATQLRQDLREKARQLSSNEGNSAASVMNAASVAAKAQQTQADKEMAAIRDRYKSDVKKLEDDFEVKLSKEKKNLQHRLENRRKERERELQKSGKSPAEAKELISNEEKHAISELEEKLLAEKESKIQEKKKEAVQAETNLLEREHQRALLEAKNAEVNKQHLQEDLDKIKHQHEEDAHVLEERLATKRKQQETALQQRLSDRRQMKLKQAANEEERKNIEEELVKEEQQLVTDFQRQQLLEEEKAKEKQREEQEAAMAKALQELKNAEIEAAMAIAKEKTADTIKSMQNQAEQDSNLKEVQKLRAEHDLKDEKRQQEQEQQRTVGKGKLEERLAMKRSKREKELKDKEEKAFAELAAKQKAEAEEKERLRVAKMSWMEKLQEVVSRARKMKISARERENFCCQETLGKKGMVPEIQMNEAVSMILKDRHDGEMTDMLTNNFDERISALRVAVEKVIEEKSAAKIALVEKLSNEGVSNERINDELTLLDNEFNQKQLAAEKNATAVLEEKHLRNQLDVKKRQLQEIAEIVSLYSDPETLKRLASQANSLSPEEQLNQYQQRIETERKQREEQLLKEQVLRQKLQDEMNKLQEEINQEQQKVEAEFEKKRMEMVKQKEELTKKQFNEKETLQIAEKQRILSNFEKEQAAALESLNKDRLNKKARLTERLNRRRSTAPVQPGAAATPQVLPSEDLLKSSETVHRQESAGKLLKTKPMAAVSEGGAAAAAAVIPPALTQSINLIESKLERIEKVISALEKSGLSTALSAASPVPVPAAVSSPAAAMANNPNPSYQDRDEPQPGERLEAVAEAELAVQERARLDFGKRIAAMIGLKNLNIQSAVSLPPSGLSGNSFANSYCFSPEENTLFVHHSRLASSGDFGLVVIHALSHIKVNSADLSNDNDPRFLSEFYKNLKILSQDLYKKTAVAGTTNPMTGLSVGQGQGKGQGGPTSSSTERGGGGGGAKRQKSLGRSSFNMFGPNNTGETNDLQQSMLLAAALAGDDTTSVVPSPMGGGEKQQTGFFREHEQQQPGGQGGQSADYFSHDSLVERMKVYAQQGGIPLDYIERYSASNNNNNNNPKQP
jgi:hypothetical protein